jgi:hypothetical protein
MPRRTPPFLIRSPNSKQLECTAKNTQSSPHNHFQELVRLETSKLGVPNSPNSNSPPRRVENKKKTVFGERRRITTAGQKIMCTDAEKGGPIWPTQSTATRTHSEMGKLQLPAQPSTNTPSHPAIKHNLGDTHRIQASTQWPAAPPPDARSQCSPTSLARESQERWELERERNKHAAHLTWSPE